MKSLIRSKNLSKAIASSKLFLDNVQSLRESRTNETNEWLLLSILVKSGAKKTFRLNGPKRRFSRLIISRPPKNTLTSLERLKNGGQNIGNSQLIKLSGEQIKVAFSFFLLAKKSSDSRPIFLGRFSTFLCPLFIFWAVSSLLNSIGLDIYLSVLFVNYRCKKRRIRNAKAK